MIDLVKFIVTAIVDNPDDIHIEETTDETGTIILNLTVNPDDMGKVIGKGGKIISAIRELVKVKAIKQGKRVRLILQDPDQPETEAPAGPEDKSKAEPENSDAVSVDDITQSLETQPDSTPEPSPEPQDSEAPLQTD